MQKVKNRPHVLDNEMIDRSIRLYTAQNEDNDIILQQCNIWKKEILTEVQLYQVEEIERLTRKLITINNEILEIILLQR